MMCGRHYVKTHGMAFCFSCFLIVSLPYASTTSELDRLRLGFSNPPVDCKPHTYWWWPGNAVTKEGIAWQLQQMHDKGMGGVLITSAAPEVYEKGNIEYLSDEYLEMVRYTIQVAKSLDMKVYLNFSSGWVYGGSWLPQEERAQSLVHAAVDLSGPQSFSGLLPKFKKAADHRGEIHVEDIPDIDKLVAVVAARIENGKLEPDSLVELTDLIRNNPSEWTWQVPDGEWRIMAFWLKYTGQRSHDEHWCIDHFNKAAVQKYCGYVGEKFQRAFGDEFGDTLVALHCDSFELANLPDGIYWSDTLLEEFQNYHGYDLTPYLPAIWYDLGEVTPKIRYDVSELLHHAGLHNFVEPFLDWCSEHGLQGSMEPIGFPTDVIQTAGTVPLPMLEITPGEKDAVPWFDTRIGPKKYISSGAHLYGRNVVGVEAYTYLHWELYRATLEELKIASDGFLRSGANKFFNHGYSYSPERDIALSRSLPFAARISHPNVWWDFYPLLANYVARCCYMLRQGHFAPDIAVYSPLANQWALDVLNARKWTRDFNWGELGNLLIANGYDFDLVNDDVLQHNAKIDSNEIHVGDLHYKLLILPNIQTIPLKTMEFIERYVREGGIVIALERLPSQSTGFVDYKQKDKAVQSLAEKIYKSKRYGDGYAYRLNTVMDRSDVLDRQSSAFDPFLKCIRQHCPPDFGIDFAHEGIRENQGLTFMHRKAGDIDIYFVTNIQDHPSEIPITFRVENKPPWQWNPYDASVRRVWQVENVTGGIKIPLRLAPYESTFILFYGDGQDTYVESSNFYDIVNKDDNTFTALAADNGRHDVCIVRDGKRLQKTLVVDSIPAPFCIPGPWRLTLEGRDFPKIEKTLPRLVSWTDDTSTRHFSGTGRYEVTFSLPEIYRVNDLMLYLDLGQVGNVAEVRINDSPVGISWMRGQRLEITGALHSGENRMEILVTNTLINRVSGLKAPPPVPEELVDHYGRGMTTYSASFHGPIGFEPLPASGLLGPVKIVPYKRVSFTVQ